MAPGRLTTQHKVESMGIKLKLEKRHEVGGRDVEADMGVEGKR